MEVVWLTCLDGRNGISQRVIWDLGLRVCHVLHWLEFGIWEVALDMASFGAVNLVGVWLGYLSV